MLEIINSVA